MTFLVTLSNLVKIFPTILSSEDVMLSGLMMHALFSGKTYS